MKKSFSEKKIIAITVVVACVFILCTCLVIAAINLDTIANLLPNDVHTSGKQETSEDSIDEENNVEEIELIQENKIAFIRGNEFPIGGELWAMDRDGQNQRKLNGSISASKVVGWSQNNKYIIVETSKWKVVNESSESKIAVVNTQTGKLIAESDLNGNTYGAKITGSGNLYTNINDSGSHREIRQYSIPELEVVRTIDLTQVDIEIGMSGFAISENNNWLVNLDETEYYDMRLINLETMDEEKVRTALDLDGYNQGVNSLVTWHENELYVQTWDSVIIYNPETEASRKLIDIDFNYDSFTNVVWTDFGEHSFYYYKTFSSRNGDINNEIRTYSLSDSEDILVVDTDQYESLLNTVHGIKLHGDSNNLLFYTNKEIFSHDLESGTTSQICSDCSWANPSY